ncbi:two-component sensor histidine kinase [Streptomyces sioyaensis]|uniref:histidine kinase n=2 Tax=Streptomyces sioyaensis TaxID=67364 RepID=A0A4V1NQG7_9ACTN|nr:two-component sensor histidine kinase [Streptomyces sioyaensis]RXS68260.1 two-component sensor histidine kinase [Streptomyces sioyaensis]
MISGEASAPNGLRSRVRTLCRMRPWYTVVLDVVIALGCALLDPQIREGFAPGEIYSPLSPSLSGWLTAAAGLLLLFRRRFPVAVAAVVTGGLLLGTGSVLTVSVAYYSLARHTRQLRTAGIAASLGLVTVLAIAVVHLQRLAPRHGMGASYQGVMLIVVLLAAVILPVLAGLRSLSRHPGWWESRRAMLFDVFLVLLFPLANPPAVFTSNAVNHDTLLLPVPVFAALVPLAGLTLVLRRRYPAGVALAAIALLPLVLPALSTLPVALYTVAKYGRSRRQLLMISGAAAAMLLGWAYSTNLRVVTPLVMVLLVSMVVVPVLLGMYRGAKQSLLVNLRERAERLEREQHLKEAQARMQERARIAREMHDVVSHRVSLMVVHAGALEAGAGGDNEVARKTGALIGQMGRQALNELRDVLNVLRMDGADDQHPAPSLPTLDDVTTLVEESRSTGTPIGLDINGDPRTLPADLSGALYRLVQEGLTNAAKHASGAPVRVEVRYLTDAVRVRVENDAPHGPSGTELPSGGRGLVGLGERVTALGGTFTSGGRPDGGFAIEATVPLAGR